ncbi:MAG: hypothetical protein D4R64_02945 [Porphyromonadaceae bacterium]|nr:MAG: hypothetical protein D4R64_02945 [Porphyromonadaceae bacterium]
MNYHRYSRIFSQIDPGNKVPGFMDILNKIKQIQSLSEIGIHYSKNDFELMRNQEISDLCFSVLSQITDIPEQDLKVKIIESDSRF